VFAGPGTYVTIARDARFAPATFRYDSAGRRIATSVDLPELLDLHERWLAYVTGRASAPPSQPGVVLFTASEYSHMADVRRVFVAFQLAALAATAIAVVLAVRAGQRSPRAASVLVRDAAIAAGAGTAVVAVAATFAFDAVFLLFHEILFPQGNFLFGPESNLLAMYPDAYWSGVTLRMGLAFIAAMAAIAIVAAATPRLARR
jgi:hypothetical protein